MTDLVRCRDCRHYAADIENCKRIPSRVEGRPAALPYLECYDPYYGADLFTPPDFGCTLGERKVATTPTER